MEVGTERKIRDQIREKVEESVGVHLVKKEMCSALCSTIEMELEAEKRYGQLINLLDRHGYRHESDKIMHLKSAHKKHASDLQRVISRVFKENECVCKQYQTERLIIMEQIKELPPEERFSIVKSIWGV
jgi:rubrerythrin